MLHSILSKLPKPLDLEALISKTMELYEKHPPEKLPFRVWWWISSNSVLRTTRNLAAKQTLEDGEKLFQKQASELRRKEASERAMAAIRKYQRPATTVGFAVFIGVLSFWLRKGGTENIAGSIFRRVREALRSQ
jgi:hypothetical protein